MISNIPWLLLAVIIYNVIAFFGGAVLPPDAPIDVAQSFRPVFDTQILEIPLISGASWTLTLGDLMIMITLVLLFVEIVKSTRTSHYSIVDHALSMVVFIICIVEFLAWTQAATSVFFVIIIATLIDVVAGFTITIKAAKRDVDFGGGAV